jgi:hypothetical protein
MTPTEVDALDAETYNGFVRYMEKQARDAERAAKRRR